MKKFQLQLTEFFADWYKMSQTTYLQTEILLKDIVNYQNSIETFALVLKDSEEKYSTSLADILDTIHQHQSEIRRRLTEKTRTGSDHPTSGHQQQQQQPEVTTNGMAKSSQHLQQQQQQRLASAESKQVRKALRSILVTQDEVWGILHENAKLIEQFTQFVVTSSSNSSLDTNSQQILADLEAAVVTNSY